MFFLHKICYMLVNLKGIANILLQNTSKCGLMYCKIKFFIWKHNLFKWKYNSFWTIYRFNKWSRTHLLIKVELFFYTFKSIPKVFIDTVCLSVSLTVRLCVYFPSFSRIYSTFTIKLYACYLAFYDMVNIGNKMFAIFAPSTAPYFFFFHTWGKTFAMYFKNIAAF